MRLIWFKKKRWTGYRMPTQAELFTKNLEQFHSDQKHYLDASGNFIGYTAADSYDLIQNKDSVRYDEYLLRKKLFEDDKGIVPTGLSNVNFGHISNPNEFGGTMLQDLDWTEASHGKGLSSYVNDFYGNGSFGVFTKPDTILLTGELTAPLVEAADEQGEDDETQWFCKGCSKYFATKASLKRHHERKKSCKELCEKPIAPKGALPEKPYIVDWVDQLLTKAISGGVDSPYCKHCDVEFANKTNLNKHLSKSVACDTLAKQEFVKSLNLPV